MGSTGRTEVGGGDGGGKVSTADESTPDAAPPCARTQRPTCAPDGRTRRRYPRRRARHDSSGRDPSRAPTFEKLSIFYDGKRGVHRAGVGLARGRARYDHDGESGDTNARVTTPRPTRRRDRDRLAGAIRGQCRAPPKNASSAGDADRLATATATSCCTPTRPPSTCQSSRGSAVMREYESTSSGLALDRTGRAAASTLRVQRNAQDLCGVRVRDINFAFALQAPHLRYVVLAERDRSSTRS